MTTFGRKAVVPGPLEAHRWNGRTTDKSEKMRVASTRAGKAAKAFAEEYKPLTDFLLDIIDGANLRNPNIRTVNDAVREAIKETTGGAVSMQEIYSRVRAKLFAENIPQGKHSLFPEEFPLVETPKKVIRRSR